IIITLFLYFYLIMNLFINIFFYNLSVTFYYDPTRPQIQYQVIVQVQVQEKSNENILIYSTKTLMLGLN
ncbi:MAG: hypothetical protein ACYDA4_09550, partial [Ignavibacteriaceae bacterium]